MSETDLHIDGNGVGGLLAEIGTPELTSVLRTCQSCGERAALGEHRAYRTAGIVLRCPHCQDVAMRVGVQDARFVVSWYGSYEIGR